MIGKSTLLSALAALAALPSGVVRETRQRMRSRSGVSRLDWPATVTSSRKTRNPADPSQAYLISRAEAKRARRAEKLDACMYRSLLKNPTLTAAACSRYFA